MLFWNSFSDDAGEKRRNRNVRVGIETLELPNVDVVMAQTRNFLHKLVMGKWDRDAINYGTNYA